MWVSWCIYKMLDFSTQLRPKYSQNCTWLQRREISQVILVRWRDPARPVSRGLVKEGATRHPAIQTTLPMTGHSLATQSALNSCKDTTQMPQGRLTYSQLTKKIYQIDPSLCINPRQNPVCDLEMVNIKPLFISPDSFLLTIQLHQAAKKALLLAFCLNRWTTRLIF